MATLLAAQLKKLAVPETQHLLTGDFKQASFLYDDSEAATFTKQHFYYIGVNGLQQLIAKDEKFCEFEQNLFSQSSQSMQRYVQTSEVNQQLDVTINKFLLRLSCYMQLREAHKAMEWMVHRYNVHLRNVDTFMMCVLPFHDQQPFVMALQLLRMNSNEAAKWRWLEPVKKAGSFLPRQTLVTHCRSAKGFLGLMCTMLEKHIEANTDEEQDMPSARHLQHVISFFTQTVLSMLATGGPPSEGAVSTLLPVLTAGLKSHSLPDRILSSYLVLGQLFTQVSLAESLLRSLLNVISKNMRPNNIHSAVTVIIIMFQKQDISKVTKKAFRYLVRQPALASVLQKMSVEAKAESFLEPFLTLLTSRALKESSGGAASGMSSAAGESSNAEDEDEDGAWSPPPLSTLLMDLMQSIDLKKQIIVSVIKVLLTWCTEEGQKAGMDLEDYSFVHGPFRLFKLLENKYSSYLEETIEVMSSSDGKAVKKVAELLCKLSVQSAQKNLVQDPASTVAICLHHRQASVRQQAVEALLQDADLISDQSSVQAALALRLEDDSPQVVLALLKEPKQLWDMFEDKDLIFKTLMKQLSLKRNLSEWGEIQNRVLQALCCVPVGVGDETDVLGIVLSHLVVASKEDVFLACDLLQSPFALRKEPLSHIAKALLPLLRKVTKRDEDDDRFTQVFTHLVESASTALLNDSPLAAGLEVSKLTECLRLTSRPASLAFYILSVCCSLIEKVDKLSERAPLQRILAVNLCTSLGIVKHLFSGSGEVKIKGRNSRQAYASACLAQLKETRTLPTQFIGHLLQEASIPPVAKSLKALRFWNLALEEDYSGREFHPASDRDWLSTVTQVVNLLLELRARASKCWVRVAEDCFSSFFKVFSDSESVVKFLCMVWMSGETEKVTTAHKARLLQFAQVYLQSLPVTERMTLLNENSPLLPCLLILLSNKSERLRDVTFTLLGLVTPSQQNHSSPLAWFSQNLLHFRQEVTKDHAFLSQVVKMLLEAENMNPSPAKKRRRSSSKPPPNSTVLAWLLEVSCDQSTPGAVTAGMLRILKKLDSVESFLPLVPTLKLRVTSASESVASENKKTLSADSQEILCLLVQRFTPVVAPFVTADNGSDVLDVLLQCLKCLAVVNSQGDLVQLLILEQLRSSFMSALSTLARKTVVGELLTLMAVSGKAEVVRGCRRVIKHMTLESSIVVEELKTVLTKTSASTVRQAKRQKIQGNNLDQETETLPWKRMTILLEMLQSKKKLPAAVDIVPVAFQVLGRVLEIESEGSGEYLKQLLLALINFICSRHWQDENQEETGQVEGSHLNMDLVVQCIRSSDNGHTHHQALLLLSTAARIAPSLLLHNMMSVFTFMGANILRQDDSYSFHVIGKILDNVIPALIMACEEKGKQKQPAKSKKKVNTVSSGMMTVVLRVFVDAAPHIPAHRRTMLFKKLVQVVGADTYLWRLILLYLASVTTRQAGTGLAAAQHEDVGIVLPEADEEKTSGPLSTNDVEFLTTLIEHFSSSQLLSAFQESLKYILSLPEEKSPDAPVRQPRPNANLEEMNAEDMAVFSVAGHTPKQLRHFKFAAVYAINHLMSSQHLVGQLSESPPESYLPGYQGLLETSLTWISHVTASLQHHSEDASRRYWKLLLHKSHDLLDTLVNLLPDSHFFEAVSGLMKHDLGLVQRRAMELLNIRLQQQQRDINNPDQASMLLALVGKLQTIVHQCLVQPAVSSEEQLVNGQTALYSLKILCRLLGKREFTHFIEVLQLCVKALEKQGRNTLVSASAMLCVAEIVCAAGTHAIEYMALFMPLFVTQLQSEAIAQNDVLFLATITSLQKVIEALPLFLSPYLRDIVMQVCIISSVVGVDTESRKPAISQKLKHICGTLATVTPPRTFIPVIEKSLAALEHRMASCAECAMTMLKDHIEHMSREDLTTFSPDLLKFFFVCFDIRATHTEMSEEDIDVIEGCVIEAFVTLVFKLSETQFKPMLLQIYTWATDEESSPDRVLFFYSLCDSLADKLKSLFTLFAGHILKHSAEVLETNNSSKTKCRFFGKGKLSRGKSCRLICFVVDCLQKTFAHDTEGFTTKEKFDIVMQPLVDQLENQLGKPSVCDSRAVSHVVPCLASLAGAARDDSLWKDLNYQILLKTRSSEAKVRMWALAALNAFHKQLGEDYTQLVPEAIPFLAELMEDESDEVEKYTQKVLADMEVSVGENLQEYF